MIEKSKRNFAIFLLIWLILYTILIAITYIKSIPVYYRARSFRLQYILNVETALLIGSIYVWKQCFPPTQNTVTTGAKPKKLHTQVPTSISYHFKRVSLGFVLLCGHASYFTNYFFISDEPHIISIVCYTCLVASFHVLICLFFTNIC